MYIQTKRPSLSCFQSRFSHLLRSLLITKTICSPFAAFSSPITTICLSLVTLDHGQSLLHIHHLVLRWRWAGRKCLHMMRMWMLILLMWGRGTGEHRGAMHGHWYISTNICIRRWKLQSKTVIRMLMLSRSTTR